MRRIAIALTALGALVLGASSAQAAVLTSSGSVIYYTAGQGERNDVVIGTDRLLGGTVPVYSFKDADANPIQIGGGPCELINGVGDCRQTGITSFFVDVRDGNDTAQVATAGTNGAFPPLIGAVLIGGRGVDELTGVSARPFLAIWYPSRQVTAEAASPGTLINTEVIVPPYIAP